jgi:hypothetical protein
MLESMTTVADGAATTADQRRSGVQAALEWTLRIGVAFCFIGHGAFGLITKAEWLPYFALFGIPASIAWPLMPVIGTTDILIGLSVLVSPRRAVLAWTFVWGTLTALLRPFTGEGWWEFLERGGNYGVALALLLLVGVRSDWRSWVRRMPPIAPTPERLAQAAWVLRVTTAVLLIGHGGFGAVMQKPVWGEYLAVLGVSPGTEMTQGLIVGVGLFEIALGVVVLVWPASWLLAFVLAWKLGTEALRPLAGEPIWEFVERAGSYTAPLALLLVQRLARRSGERVAPDAAGSPVAPDPAADEEALVGAGSAAPGSHPQGGAA